MARNRNKDYSQGDRINIYLSRDVPPEFINWINKQSDLSSFFLYAAQKLYEQTGYVDVSEIMPRKINFDLTSAEKLFAPKRQAEEKAASEPEGILSPVANQKDATETIPGDANESEEKKKNEAWANFADLDDPFA